MRIDSIAVELRPRRVFEAADLGVRLLQRHAAMVARCWLPVACTVLLLALSSVVVATWLPTLLMFWLKPWLGRSVLFVLGRAAFGQSSGWNDLWRARRAVWGRQLWRALTLDRLIPWRAFVMPVVTLEGLSGRVRRQRVAQLVRGQRGVVTAVNAAYANIEALLMLGLVTLMLLMAPLETGSTLWEVVIEQGSVGTSLAMAALYALVVVVLEPVHVASGFAMYLNRRVELEAWDIEQELRRAFAPMG